MLRILMDGLRERNCGATLGFYGDHLPSLPQAFGHFGFDTPHSDYVIWRDRIGESRQLDLPAHALGRLAVDGVLGGNALIREPAARRDRAAAAPFGAIAPPFGSAER
jgi:hypothetical protein